MASLEAEVYDRQHWLEPLRLVAVGPGDEVHVAAPDSSHAEWVAQHWLPQARWVTGVEVRA